MCGIFGFIAREKVNKESLMTLALHARQRGRDSSGLIYADRSGYQVKRADYDIKKLISEVKPFDSAFVFGHSRLITNGLSDNQPVVRGGVCVIHNGIIVNDAEVWNHLKPARALEIDSEVIAAITEQHLEESGDNLDGLAQKVLGLCVGVIACAIVIPRLGKALLFSNNGSLYVGTAKDGVSFSSEMFPLSQIGCTDIKQVRQEAIILDLPAATDISVADNNQRVHNLIPPFQFITSEEKQLLYPQPNLRRCTRCILPETMPFIDFDADGVCNYCHNYSPRNVPKPKEELFNLVEGYRRAGVTDCIVPFSGGRDSCYGLHLIVKELKMNPVTYTYDWGMVTDLGRRNISRMSAELGVENIIVADDIAQKRRNIAVNLKAWLKAPHLGMISILTAGDKHFFRHIETVKQQTGVSLNLWA
jgi:asparagine synthetase B (glutamine-hydrolysing)